MILAARSAIWSKSFPSQRLLQLRKWLRRASALPASHWQVVPSALHSTHTLFDRGYQMVGGAVGQPFAYVSRKVRCR